MEQLIYIEMNDKIEAAKLSGGFALESTKTRAYVNALGVELAMKYLAQEGISVSNVHNLHNIHNFREDFDVADIMLSNIHIDVRVVYDENLIFIPKSHEEYGFTPDIYLVFKLAEDSSHVKFLGFFEPKLINKNNQNDEYYFIEKEKLSHPSDLGTYVQDFNGNTTEALSEEVMDNAKRLALSLIDHEITVEDKKYLISLLKKSVVLREEIAEFDNFEWVSYHTVTNEDFEDVSEEIAEEAIEEIQEEEIPSEPLVMDEFDVFDSEDEFTELENDIFDDVVEDVESDIDTTEEVAKDLDDEAEEIVQSEETFEFEDVDNILEEDVIETPEEEPLEENSVIDEVIDESVEESQLLTFDEIAEDTLTLEDTTEGLDVVDKLAMELVEDSVEELEESAQEESAEVIAEDELEVADEFLLEEDLLSVEEDKEVEELISDTDTADIIDSLLSDNFIESIGSQEEETPELSSVDDLITENTSLNDIMPDLINETVSEVETTSFEDFKPMDELVSTEASSEEVEFNPADSVVFEEPVEDVSTQQYEAIEDEEIPEAPVAFEDLAQIQEIETNEVSADIDNVLPEEDLTNVYENSMTINNQDIVVGEIPIDINQPVEYSNDEDLEKLEVLYNSDNAFNEVGQNIETPSPEKGKKAVVAAAVVVAALAGVLVYSTINKTNDETAEAPSVLEQNMPKLEEQPIPDNIEEVIPKADQDKIDTLAKQVSAEASKPKGPAIETPYIDVKKLSWAVPDYLSYNDSFKKYLQTTGKSLKLSLSSDLLLATEYSYSNLIEVDITLAKEGTIKGANIIQSSGSTQIDNIVLQTVKETLNVLKAPAGLVVGDTAHLTLKIYL